MGIPYISHKKIEKEKPTEFDKKKLDQIEKALVEFKVAISMLDSHSLDPIDNDYGLIEDRLFNVEKTLEKLNYLTELKKVPYAKDVRKYLKKSRLRVNLNKVLDEYAIGIIYSTGLFSLLYPLMYYVFKDQMNALGGTILFGIGLSPFIVASAIFVAPYLKEKMKGIVKSPVKNVVKYAEPMILALEKEYKL